MCLDCPLVLLGWQLIKKMSRYNWRAATKNINLLRKPPEKKEVLIKQAELQPVFISGRAIKKGYFLTLPNTFRSSILRLLSVDERGCEK
jgi:hypothetical protein